MITEQAFAEALISITAHSDAALDLTKHESTVPDFWTYYVEGERAMGGTCLAHHGMFDRVYSRKAIRPGSWDRFREQYHSPEARLLMQLYRACEQPTWLTWSSEDTARNDALMNQHFYTRSHQNHTYAAIRQQLDAKGLITNSTRTYQSDELAFGVTVGDRVVDFPGDYQTLTMAVDMLMDPGTEYVADTPRIMNRYGDCVPVLHMIGHTVQPDPEAKPDELKMLISQGTGKEIKEQTIVYAMSDLRDGKLTTRYVGSMYVSTLEIAYGSLAGAVHMDRAYFAPNNDLSPEEARRQKNPDRNWEFHQDRIIKGCPPLAVALGMEP